MRGEKCVGGMGVRGHRQGLARGLPFSVTIYVAYMFRRFLWLIETVEPGCNSRDNQERGLYRQCAEPVCLGACEGVELQREDNRYAYHLDQSTTSTQLFIRFISFI